MTARTRSYLFAIHGRPALYNEAYPGEPIESIGARRKAVLAVGKTLLARTLRASTSTTLPTVLRHGECVYSIGNAALVRVSDADDCVLLAFLEKQAPMEREELEKASGIPNGPQAMRRLSERYGGYFARAVRRPGKRSKGGYHISVLEAK